MGRYEQLPNMFGDDEEILEKVVLGYVPKAKRDEFKKKMA